MVVITRIRGINILNSKIDKNVELDVQGFHLPVKVDEILCLYIDTKKSRLKIGHSIFSV